MLNRPLLAFLFAVVSNSVVGQFGVFRSFSPDANRPEYVHPADLDGDGDEDVLATLSTDKRIVWYANDGSGNFGAFQIAYDNASGLRWAKAADLDGDEDLDILFGRSEQATFGWLENDGAGSFSTPQIITTCTSAPWAMEAADIDGDGDTDIVASCSNGPIRWFANDGNGGTWTEHQVGVASARTVLNCSDIDGDGDTDLLMGSELDDAVVGWCANMGAGIFGPVQVLLTGGAHSNDVRAADLDGDGDLDAAYITSFEHELGWCQNLGGGTFTPATVVSSMSEPAGDLYADDVDADGHVDLLVSTFWLDEVMFFRNSGSGIFLAPVPLTTENNGASCVVTADLDGDSDKDVLYCSPVDDEIGWIEQTAPATFAAERLLTWGVDYPTAIDLADLDGDGDLDPFSASSYEGTVVWFQNDGLGNMSSALIVAEDLLAPVPVQAGDLDQDGDIDLAVGYAEGTIGWYANNGSGTFDPLQVINASDTIIQRIELHDLNGDGTLDVLSAAKGYPGKISWYTNTGGGAFGTQQVIESGFGFSSVTAGDLDGDGDNDVLGTAYPHDLFWYANDGSGNFGPRVTVADSLNEADHLTVVDMDMDGDKDLLLVRQPVFVHDGEAPMANLPRVVWFGNDGTGEFGPEQAIAHFPTDTYMHVVDIDSDGDPDVLLATTWGIEHVTCRLNDGNGAFGTAIVLPFPPVASTNGFGTGDADDDGDPDVFTTEGGYDRLGWYENHFGSPYRIDGRVFIDMDNSGAYNAGDTTANFLSVAIAPPLSSSYTVPDGSYEFYVDPGLHTVTSITSQLLWQLSTGATSYDIEVTIADPVSTGNDFGYAALADTSILIPSLLVSNGACSDTVPLWTYFMNQGTRIERGFVRLDLDPLYAFNGALPVPDSIIGNSYYWSFDSLFFFAHRSIEMSVQLPGIDNVGDTLMSVLTVMRTDTSGAITDEFSDAFSRVVSCSCDPNDKFVEPRGYGENGAVPVDLDMLTYTIRFQNTGSDTAYNVMVSDPLSDHLDWSTLNIIATSHTITHAEVGPDGEAVFHFDGIMLPDSTTNDSASRGYISFRIAILPGQPHLAVIENEAAIHFDFNPPVITNTTVNTLVDCDLWAPQITWLGVDLLEATTGDAYQWFLNGEAIPGAMDQHMFPLINGSYVVEVMSIHGCLAPTDPYQVIFTGVMEGGTLRMGIVPNPFNSTARAIFSEPLTFDHLIDLIDVNGRVLRRIQGNGQRELTIERDGLAPGLYVLRLSGPDGHRLATRLVIE